MVYFCGWAGGSAARKQEAFHQLNFILPLFELPPITEEEWKACLQEIQVMKTHIGFEAYTKLVRSRKARQDKVGAELFPSARLVQSSGPPLDNPLVENVSDQTDG
jgi:hypothetical protein